MKMNLLPNMTISKKIVLIMSATTLVLVVLSLVSNFALTSTVSTFSSLIENETTMLHDAHIAKISMLRFRSVEKDALYNDDASLLKSIETLSSSALKNINSIELLVRKVNDADMTKTIKELNSDLESYQKAFRIAVKEPVGQKRMRASIPMRKTANSADKNLDLFLELVDSRINKVKTETLARADKMKKIVLIVSISFVFVVILFATLLRRSIVIPLNKIGGRMLALSKGELDADIPFLRRSDEIGSMAQTVQIFKDNLIETKKLKADQELSKKRAEEEAQKILLAQTEKFESSVATIVNAISSAAKNMESTATTMLSTAEGTSHQATSVAAAASQASSNVQAVAASAEELSSSVNEISRQVSQSSEGAKSAEDKAMNADRRVQGLSASAQKIGEVVKLINDIASQTNLLALNATIEAARAGEAGKGFAVVASEVKALANQTAKATEEISKQISEVQTSTSDAVSAIQDIGNTIKENSEIASAIAAAVEEQGAATKEIALNVQQAASGTHEVSTNINEVTRAAEETGNAANMVMTVAKELSLQAIGLRKEVDSYIASVRSTK